MGTGSTVDLGFEGAEKRHLELMEQLTRGVISILLTKVERKRDRLRLLEEENVAELAAMLGDAEPLEGIRCTTETELRLVCSYFKMMQTHGAYFHV